jgi:hypothetical protein
VITATLLPQTVPLHSPGDVVAASLCVVGGNEIHALPFCRNLKFGALLPLQVNKGTWRNSKSMSLSVARLFLRNCSLASVS